MARIVQTLNSLSYGDAIGNHVLALDDLLESQGVEHAIYAASVVDRYADRAQVITSYEPRESDLVLHHLSIGCDLNSYITSFPGKLVIAYHNVTPSHFFWAYDKDTAQACERGYADVRMLASHADAAIVDSDYNGTQLAEMGYDCPITTVPILLSMEGLDTEPSPEVLASRAEDRHSCELLFVGRIAPNKRIEKLVEDFCYYQRYINSDSRLTIVGSAGGMSAYLLRLQKYIRKLRVKNVVITGHVALEELLAYYKSSDVFLCESAHEGFCVPLVEAMHFGLPIVARDTSAVGETLGDAGILLTGDDSREAAVALDCVMRSDAVRTRMAGGRMERLARFSPSHVRNEWLDVLGLV